MFTNLFTVPESRQDAFFLEGKLILLQFTFSSSYVAEISINGSSLATKDDFVAIFAYEEWSQFFT